MTAPLPRLRCPTCERRYPGLPPRLCPKDQTPLVPADDLAEQPRSSIPPPVPVEAELAGEQISGRFTMERQIASGSFGAVYLAQRRLPQGGAERCVVKVFHPHLADNPSHVERFVREARALTRIAHPNVVRLFDAGALPDGRLFLALEHGGEQTLAQLIARGPMDPTRALRITAQVLSALHAAHKEGIVHRDLKPANILVTRHDNEDRVKVCDFGVAKMLATFPGVEELSALTREGSLVGTPAYFSPEQACGLPVDARTDLYAMGVVLYELLAGRRPLHAASVKDWIEVHTTREPPTFAQLGIAVPAEVERLVRKALAKGADERFRSAKEMQAAVAEILGAPVPSKASLFLTRRELRQQEGTSTEQLERPRSRVLLFAGVMAFAFVAALGGLGLWWQLWERPACVDARKAKDAGRWAEAVRLSSLARVHGIGCLGIEPLERTEEKSALGLMWIPRPDGTGFWFTRTEVHTGAFQACVKATVCTKGALDGCGEKRKAGACVGEQQAAKLCRWIGGHLPTDEEKKAALHARAQGRAPWLDAGVLDREEPLGFRCALN